MDKIIINIATDYTDTPGGRYIKDGKYSGEDFRETMLFPKYMEAVNEGVMLEVNLDGCFGYPSSFLDEAFGGIAKALKRRDILDNIIIISNDQPGLYDDIKKSINEVEFEG